MAPTNISYSENGQVRAHMLQFIPSAGTQMRQDLAANQLTPPPTREIECRRQQQLWSAFRVGELMDGTRAPHQVNTRRCTLCFRVWINDQRSRRVCCCGGADAKCRWWESVDFAAHEGKSAAGLTLLALADRVVDFCNYFLLNCNKLAVIWATM